MTIYYFVGDEAFVLTEENVMNVIKAHCRIVFGVHGLTGGLESPVIQDCREMYSKQENCVVSL